MSNDNIEQQDEVSSELEKEVIQDQQEEPEVSEEEQKARSNGWDPTKGNKTAREFNLTGELIELKKTLQKRDKDIEDIIKYQQTAIESQKQSFKNQLEQKLTRAKEIGDINQIENIYKEKAQIEQQDLISKQEKQKADIQNQVEMFKQRNAHWYNETHPDMMQEAHNIESKILSGQFQLETGIPKPQAYEDVLRQVEMAMKMNYPDTVSTGIKNRGPSISATSSNINKQQAANTNDNVAYSKLTNEQKVLYDNMKRILSRSGKNGKPIDYTVKDFIAKLKSDGEI